MYCGILADPASIVYFRMEIEEAGNEITEVESSEPVIRNRNQSGLPPSFPPESAVYVAVGEGSSSMTALSWALQNEIQPHSSKIVYLIHIFPEIHHIPTPLGNIDKSKLNPQQIEAHMMTVRSKRRELLQKFINVCYSAKVEVDTVLIESDQISKAILELIPVLHISTLVVGASKSKARKLNKGVKHILEGAPDYCKVKIISDGKEITAKDQFIPSSTKMEKHVNKGKGLKLNQNSKDSVQSCCCIPIL